MWAAETAARDIQIKIKELTKKVIREKIYKKVHVCVLFVTMTAFARVLT